VRCIARLDVHVDDRDFAGLYGSNRLGIDLREVSDIFHRPKPARTLGTRYGSHSAYSIIGNLGKKSIAVDLKSDAGKQVVWRLLKGADVFLEGFRPGVIQRLGFDYKSVAEREPRLLYLSISGFGQSGPLSSRPAMDPVLQAYTGLMNENRGEDMR